MQSVNPLDEAAFTELYVQHVDAVYRICYSFLKNRTDAEDAVQETFLRLMQSQKLLENDAHLRGWLVVTASNVCKNMLHSWLWQKRQEVEDWFMQQNIYLANVYTMKDFYPYYNRTY